MTNAKPSIHQAAWVGGIYEDSRQQGGKHENKHCWWDAHGVTYQRKKLDFGDYMDASGLSNVSVDTKRSISEVAMDVGRDHARFVREIERANTAGFRLVVLIEVGGPYSTIDAIERWTAIPCRNCANRRYGSCDPHASGCARFRSRPMQGETVLKIMRRLEQDHGCRFEVCRPSQSARRICELLGVRYDNG